MPTLQDFLGAVPKAGSTPAPVSPPISPTTSSPGKPSLQDFLNALPPGSDHPLPDTHFLPSGAVFGPGVVVKHKSLFDQAKNALATYAAPAIGAAKEVGKEAIQATNVSTDIMDAIMGKIGVKPPSYAQHLPSPGVLNSTNSGQQGGAEAVKLLPYLAGGEGPLLAKTGLAGAVGVAASLAQGGTPKQAAVTGAINAAIPGVGEAVGLAAGPIKEAVAEKLPPDLIKTIISIPKKLYTYGKDPVQAYVDEGLTGHSVQAIAESAKKAFDPLNKAMEEITSNPTIANVKTDITSALKPINDAMDSALGKGSGKANPQLYNDLVALRDEITNTFKVGKEGQAVKGAAKSLELTPSEIKDLKTSVGVDKNWTGNPNQSTLESITGKVYNGLKTLEETATKGITDSAGNTMADLNARYGNLISFSRATNDQLLKEAAGSGTTKKLLEKAAVVAGAASQLPSAFSHPIQTATNLAMELGVYAGYKALTSPAAITRMAETLSRLSPEEATFLSTKVFPVIKALFLQSVGSGKEQTPQENPNNAKP